MTELLESRERYECVTCGHEWANAPADSEAVSPRVVLDANGNSLQDGDAVILIKDLKLKGGGGTLKGGTKVKGIRIVDGDHELDCKAGGMKVMLKACFVKKA